MEIELIKTRWIDGMGMDDSATLVERFERVFSVEPDALALAFLDDGERVSVRLSRRELRAQVLSLAARLQREGGFGERALLLFPTGPEFVRAYLACLYAGVVPVPCYPPARTRPDARIDAIARTAKAKFALTTTRVGANDARRLGWYPALAQASWILVDDIDPTGAAEWTPPAVGPDTLALIQFTSGSTGDPRGVLVTHANLLANLRDVATHLDHDRHSVMVSWLPLFHDLGLIYGLLQPLAEGHLGVLIPPAAFLQQPLRWLRVISDFRATHAAAPNFAYELCVARVSEETLAGLDLSTWRVAVNAAEPVRDETLRRFADRFAPAGFRPEAFCPAFGLAEATLHVTSVPAHQAAARAVVDPEALKAQRVLLVSSAASKALSLVSSGQPVHPTAIRIVDPDTLQLCEPDRVGEIWVCGSTVAAGYFDHEDASAATFGARIPGDAHRYLRTGDLGFLHRGQLFVTGRLKDIVILHGANYYPQDFEATVESCHPALASAGSAAFAIDGPLGDGLAVVAELERANRKRFDPLEIIQSIRRAITQTQGVAVEHVTLIDPHTLPRTTSGKVQRRGCRERLLAGDLAVIARWQRGQDDAAPPSFQTQSPSDLLAWLRQRLAQRLGIEVTQIDPDVSWASLGLDSVGAMELSGELSRHLDRPVEPTAWYDHPSLRALAEYLSPVDQVEPNPAPAMPMIEPATSPEARDIAIIGMACRFPGADSPEAFWTLLSERRCTVGVLPPERLAGCFMVDGVDDPVGRRGGFLRDVEQFDAAFFGIAPREADRMDPQQRILLELAWEALERASIPPHSMASTLTGVFIGASNVDYLRMLLSRGSAREPYLGTGNALSILANRISYTFDFKGPSLALDTACSSSLVSIAMACQSLRRRESNLALAGGVNLILSPEITLGFAASGMLAADGLCKAFSADADGYVRSEGAGLLVLKRLTDAQRDGDEVLAVIRGVAVGQDGRSAGLTAPNGTAQQAVVRSALLDAGVKPAAIGYVEAHGTGTPLGDPIEVHALAQVLGEGREAGAPCWVGSVKSNIGHLESAAGVAGVFKAVLALRHHLVPATLHCNLISPRLELGGVLRVANDPQPWPPGKSPRLAGVSSFGFGGTNAHLVLAEASSQPTDPLEPAEGPVLPQALVLSARDPAALRALARGAASALHGANPARWAAACHESQVGRSPMPERMGLVVSEPEAAAQALSAWVRGQDPGTGVSIAEGRCEPGERPRIAFLFTGHGAQWPGMGRELYEREPVFRAAMATCDEILGDALGARLSWLLYGDAPVALDDMRVTQPAIFSVQYALARVWDAWGVRLEAALGHSLGELAAACVAGSLDLESALGLVVARGLHLQSIQAQGLMIATTAPEPLLSQVLAPWEGQLSLAAANGPGQLVFAGDRAAALAAAAVLCAKGAKCTPLDIVRAFHSPLVDPILQAFEADAARILGERGARKPNLPLLSNVSGDWIEDPPGASYWRSHLRSPVRFAQGLQTLIDAGYRQFVEIGPHPTLLTIAASQHDSPELGWHASLHRRRGGLEQMMGSACALWTRGASVKWPLGRRPIQPLRKVLPTYPFQRRRHGLPESVGLAPVASTALPGRRLSLASEDISCVFQGWLNARPSREVHRLQGRDWLSAPTMLAAIVDAALQEPAWAETSALSLEDVVWNEPLELSDDQAVETQLVCRFLPQGLQLLLHSREVSSSGRMGAMRASWTEHLQVRIDRSVPLASTRGMLAPTFVGEPLPKAAFYAALRERGLELPDNELLDAIEVGPGCARAVSKTSAAGEQPLRVLCEVALQTAAAAWGLGSDLAVVSSLGRAILPTQMDASHLVAQAHCAGASHRVDVDVFDGSGKALARFEGLTFRPTRLAGPVRYGLSWQPLEPPVTLALPAERWLVVEGEDGGGEVLARRLRGEGAEVGVVRLSAIGDASGGLDAAAGRLTLPPQGVICLAPGDGSAAVEVAGALLRRPWSVRLWLVTCGATSVDESGRLDHVLEAGAWGVGRCLALEHPSLWGGLMDCESLDPDARAASVVAALLRWTRREDQVAWRSGRALVPRLRVLPDATSRIAPLRADASYLITGGAGALGLALAESLVEGGARSLVLVGRAPAPGPSQEATIQRLRLMGAELRYLSLDVSQAQAVNDCVQALAREPLPLCGIFHAAGVPGRCRVRDMSSQIFSEVFAPKALGALTLAQATRELTLDFFVCVGSMVSAWGAGEQAHYAAANAVADAVVAALAASGRPAVSLALGPLSGGMLPASVATAMEMLGARSATLSQAAQTVVARRGSHPCLQVIAQVDWALFSPVLEPDSSRGFLDELRPAGQPAEATRGGLPPSLAGADRRQIEDFLRERVLQQVSKVLGVAPGQWGDVRRGFFDRGMDSITALELRRRLEREFGLALPVSTVFDHPNVSALAREIADRLMSALPGAPESGAEDDPLASALTRLEQVIQER